MITLNWKLNRFPELRRKLPHIAVQIVEKHTDAGVSLMKQLAPVRTGFLRDSIHKAVLPAEMQGLVASRGIEIDAPYWVYVEYGTVHMSAQPFVTPAMESVRSGFVAECSRIINRELR
mgnify:CR=1 FL=1